MSTGVSGKTVVQLVHDLDIAHARIAELEAELSGAHAALRPVVAERDRLRAALTDIAAVHPSIDNILWVIERSRAALSDPSGENIHERR